MGTCLVATPEPPSQQPDTPSAQQQPTPEPQAAQPPISQQLNPQQPPADAVPPGPPTPQGTPTTEDAPTPQHVRPQGTPAQPGTPPPGVPIPPPAATPLAATPPGAAPSAGAPPFGVPASPYPPQPGMPSATASQPLWPVQPPQQFAPVTGQQPGLPPGGPAASYPALHPVGQPQQPYPGPPPAKRRPANPIPGRQLFGGIALIVAAGLAVGGSIPSLDHIVDKAVNSDNTLGEIDNVVDTSAWYFHSDTPGHPNFAYHLIQFFGIGLGVGALLALVFGLFLLFGLGRRIRLLPTFGAVGAAVLFGAVLTTEMSPIDDMQADNYTPPGGHTTPGAHVTTFGLGFWLLLGAGVVALVAMVLLLMRERRVEPPTPRFGIPVQPAPVSVPQAPGYPAQQYPGAQHG